MRHAASAFASLAIFGTSAAMVGRRLLLPTSLAAALAAWLARPDDALSLLGDEVVDAALWRLHVPAAILTCFAAIALLDTWPGACRDRRDAAWLGRDLAPPWRGFVAASAGAGLGLAVALALIGLVFALVGRATTADAVAAHAFVALTHDASDADAGVTRGATDTARFVLAPGAGPIDALVIRGNPRRAPQDPWRPAEFTLRLDGVALELPALTIWSPASRHFVRLHSPRSFASLELVPVRAGAPRVEFAPGSIEARRAEPRSRTLNIVLAALTYMLPAALVAALFCVLQGLLAMSIATLTAIGVVLTATMLDFTPNAPAIAEVAAGRWLPATAWFAAGTPALATIVSLLLIAAIALRWRRD